MLKYLPLILLAFQQAPPDREKVLRDAVEKGVTFPAETEIAKWHKKGATHRKVLDFFLSKSNWVKALQRVEQRIGLVGDSVSIRLEFVTQSEKAPMCGGGTGGKGMVGFDIEALATYWDKKEKFEAGMRQEGAAVVVPPPNAIGMIAHELAHCYQGEVGKQPIWFLEGMATFVADDPHFVAFFRHEKEKVADVDVFTHFKFAYPRGWAFLEFVKAQHGDDKFKKMIHETMVHRRPVQKCMPEIVGIDWAKIKADEREWTTKWMANFKIVR